MGPTAKVPVLESQGSTEIPKVGTGPHPGMIASRRTMTVPDQQPNQWP
jgi:hypothetical protein